MSDCDGKRGRFTVHTPASWNGTLANRLIGIEDRASDIEVRLGLRPYKVSVVRVRWSGDRRGSGVQEVVGDLAILPVPRITDLSGLQLISNAAMVREQGSVMVSRISGAYTEDQLAGLDVGGVDLPPTDEVFWEVVFLRSGDRRRFTVTTAPGYDAERAQWSLTLTRAHEGRARNSSLR